MNILFYGALFFCSAFCVHLCIWRMRLPKNQTAALLNIFISCLIIGIVILNIFLRVSFFDCLRLSFLYISAMLAYIISYSAIEADSPSISIVLKIAEKGKDGLKKEELDAFATNEALIIPRLNDLLKGGLAILNDNKYKITLKGRYFVGVFVFFRKLLNVGKGG